MTIQFILSAGLFAILLYVLMQRERSKPFALISCLVLATASYFVWFPEQSNRIAQFLGIGRGADLVLYCWVLLSLLLVFNFHLKVRKLEHQISEITRSIALAEAQLAPKATND